MSGVRFEWNEAKNATNITKHGVDFAMACEIFKDPFGREQVDDRQDYGEERYVIIGRVEGRLLTVTYTMRGEDVIRIISARGATPYEQRKYREEDR